MADFLSNLLGAVSLSVTDLMEEATQETLGVGGQAAGALVLLALRPRMNIKRLAERLRLSHPGTVRLTDKLVLCGWVERKTDADDRRTVRLSLTAAGLEQIDRVRQARGQHLAKLLDGFSASERAALEPLLVVLMKRLTVDAISAYANCRLCDTPACQAAGCPVDAKVRSLFAHAEANPFS